MDPINRDRLLRELTDFLRIPSVSTNASHNADCRAAEGYRCCPAVQGRAGPFCYPTALCR